MEARRLNDEVETLTAAIKAAIEEAIKNGQKSVEGLNDISESSQVSSKDFALADAKAYSEVDGRVDDS